MEVEWLTVSVVKQSLYGMLHFQKKCLLNTRGWNPNNLWLSEARGRGRGGRRRGAHDGRPLLRPRLHVPRQPRRGQQEAGGRHDAAEVVHSGRRTWAGISNSDMNRI